MPARLIASLCLVLSLQAAARELDIAKPESVAMSSARLAHIRPVIDGYVDAGKLAGAVTMVARDGKVVYVDVVGKRDVESGAAMTRDTLFRIYSMSKPITAVAAMILYEEGRFQLQDPVSKFLPELASLTVWQENGEPVPAAPMTLQQLMTHTAGLTYGFTRDNPVDTAYQDSKLLQAASLDEFVQRLAGLPLRFEPGSRWHYSVASDVLGAVIERISGKPFDVFLAERVFRPLGMHDTFFSVPDDKLERFGTNHVWNAERGALDVVDRPADSRFRNVTFFSGGGGLVSTTDDYMRFALMLGNGGSYEGTRILSPKTVQFMTADHLPATVRATGSGERPTVAPPGRSLGFGFGLGFGINTNPPATGVIGSPGEFSWGGAAGTIFWVDPVEKLVVVGMIQLMRSPWPLRSELKVLTNQALTALHD